MHRGAGKRGGRGPAALRRPPAPALALLALAFLIAQAASGCGAGASSATASGNGAPPTAGEVRLVVSRDFGRERMVDVTAPYRDGMSVMRLLAEQTTVDTGYGGRFVNGINGVKSSFGTTSSDDASDWFYWVDGVMADVGADDWRLKGGETVWWDYHRWANAMFVPATLSAFPAPFVRQQLDLIVADGVGEGLGAWLDENGLTTGERQGLGDGPPVHPAVVVATTAAAFDTGWLRDLIAQAGQHGVALTQTDGRLARSADAGGSGEAITIRAAGFAEQVPDRPTQLVLVLLGQSAADVDALLGKLDARSLSGRVAVALEGDGLVPLPAVVEEE